MVAFGLGGSPSCTGSQMADAQPRLAARNAPGTFWPVREAGGSARLGADPHADAAERATTDGAVTTACLRLRPPSPFRMAVLGDGISGQLFRDGIGAVGWFGGSSYVGTSGDRYRAAEPGPDL